MNTPNGSWRKVLRPEIKPKNHVPTSKHGGGGMMIWVCFSVTEKADGIMRRRTVFEFFIFITAQQLNVRNRKNYPKHALNVAWKYESLQKALNFQQFANTISFYYDCSIYTIN